MNERTFHAANAHKLEDPERRTWLPPEELIRLLELHPDSEVADIGAGTGYFALPIAEVLETGTVYAVDLQEEMLDRLRAKLDQAPPRGSVRLFQGDAAATGLPASSVDRVLMANLWHELDDQPAALREAARILRPGGRLLILDWRPDMPSPPGPPSDHRIPAEVTAATVDAAAWQVLGREPFGKFHYVVIAQPQS